MSGFNCDFQPIDTAPWGEWVLVYRPHAETVKRMFGMDIRHRDEYRGVWKYSRPDEQPTMWCIPRSA